MDIEIKEKICFFGGCFSPPTKAHIRIIEELCNKFNKVYIVPTNDKYDKKGLMKFKDRINMLNLVKENLGYENLEISDIENIKNIKFKTYEILDIIYKKFKKTNSELFFVLGSDNLQKMSAWDKVEDILNKYNFIIIQRDKTSIHNIIKSNKMLLCKQNKFTIFDILTEKEREISSSQYNKLDKKSEILKDYIIQYLSDIV